MMMTITAPAKINLFLAVDAKRSDGYHELRTVLHKISLQDQLRIEEAEGFSLEVSGIESPRTNDNLVMRSAQLYSESFGTPGARIFLHKNIPVGAGLGGGSSDAAATLKALQRIYGKGSDAEISEIAAKIGADVPFFITGQSAFATGTGTDLTLLPAIDLGWIAIIKPADSLSTASVYKELRSADYHSKVESKNVLRAFYENDISSIADSLYNSLEAPAFRLLPKLADMKKKLVNLGGKALLSGSGSAVFALFEDEDRAKHALESMKPYCEWSGLFRSGDVNEEN
jgi:4-diphosphocytidyl-2-C-methyl-D-erythritol kinase